MKGFGDPELRRGTFRVGPLVHARGFQLASRRRGALPETDGNGTDLVYFAVAVSQGGGLVLSDETRLWHVEMMVEGVGERLSKGRRSSLPAYTCGSQLTPDS